MERIPIRGKWTSVSTDSQGKAVSRLNTSGPGEYKFGANGMSRHPADSSNATYDAKDGQFVLMEYDSWMGHIRSTVSGAPTKAGDWRMYLPPTELLNLFPSTLPPETLSGGISFSHGTGADFPDNYFRYTVSPNNLTHRGQFDHPWRIGILHVASCCAATVSAENSRL